MNTLDEMSETIDLAETLIKGGQVQIHRKSGAILVNGRPLTDTAKDRELENLLQYMIAQGMASLEVRTRSPRSNVRWVEA